MEKKDLKIDMRDAEIKEAFDQFDKTKSGFLNEADFPAFSFYLISSKKLNEGAVTELIKSLKPRDKRVAYDEVISSWRRRFLHQYSSELDAPAVKLILLLKHMKDMPSVKETMKSEIDWSIEKITLGKVYETELDPPSPTSSLRSSNEVLHPAMAKLVEMLPWLAQFSNPRITTAEDIEAYQREKKKCVSPEGEKHEKKRKSVLLADLITEIDKNRTLMKSVGSYEFNSFEFLKAFGRKRLLPLVSYNIFEDDGVFSVIDEEKFEEFISTLRSGYNQENPFHNDIHVTDVLQMCHFMLRSGLKEIAQLDPLDVAAFLISAVVHDFKHPGVTNGFLQNTSSDLALIYNDQSILENYHISETFRVIFKQPNCNIFCKMSAEQIKIIRKRIIACILATDMARHFEIMTSLQNLISSHEIYKGNNAEKIINKKTALTEFESKQFILSACLHAADIGNPARIFPASEEWSNRVMEEFWRQGDLEKKMSLPVSYLCDRTCVNVPGSQIGFISGFTVPIFDKLSQIFPKFQPMLDYAIKSEQEWRKRQEAAKVPTPVPTPAPAPTGTKP